jgi:hypothetical protein
MDCSSHRSLIPIQRSKNENLKTEIPRITNPFSFVFIYKKRDERETKERKKREEVSRNKNRNSIISTSNDHNF